MDYAGVKLAHVSCAAISYTLVVARGIWMMRGSALLQQRWVRTVPHIVDTILLASAIVMTSMSRQYPLAEPWLTAKVIAPVFYIALGTIALRQEKKASYHCLGWGLGGVLLISSPSRLHVIHWPR